ncbi:MAG: 30S ribosomal protein S3 [Candidatus Abawacabacteria bacterium]|nr:30S ribosomal protein S3 [Candidatus Abawacabacteria bacterium]
MGQKVHPFSFRLPVIRNWASNWFSSRKKDYEQSVQDDIKIRQYLNKKLSDAGVASIDIARNNQSITVTIRTSKPGVIIGKSGANIDQLRDELKRVMNKPIEVKIFEIRKANTTASLVAQKVGHQLERRVAYRRAIKGAIQEAMEDGALGIKIAIGGRLNGADIARRESFKEGNIPLHTLRADVDYAIYHAQTTYGVIGIKVWVYRGLVFDREAVLENSVQEAKGSKKPEEQSIAA